MFLQLFAPGRAASAAVLKAENVEFEVVGPSAVAFEGGDVPRELTVAEIEQYVEWFGEAARAFVEDAGGDGVESKSRAERCAVAGRQELTVRVPPVHAANGYLLDQFLQTNSNLRTDQYGRSVANRCRLTLDVLAAAAAAVGQDRVGLRLSPFADFQGKQQAPCCLLT
jgi:NADPH2 dehydrogenase